MGGRPASACTPRGCAASPPAWLTARAAPVSAPPRHLRSNPHPQHGLYLSFTPSLGRSLPGWWDQRAPVDPGFWTEEQAEAYAELQRELVGSEAVDQAAAQVRGHPAWIQDDARMECQFLSQGLSPEDVPEEPAAMARLKREAAAWSLLWQVPFDEEQGFAWGSSGTVFVLLQDEDLRARRFERAWLVLQCT